MNSDQANLKLMQLRVDRLERQQRNWSRDGALFVSATLAFSIALHAPALIARIPWLAEFEHRLLTAVLIASVLIGFPTWLRDRVLQRTHDEQCRQIYLSISPTSKSP